MTDLFSLPRCWPSRLDKLELRFNVALSDEGKTLASSPAAKAKTGLLNADIGNCDARHRASILLAR
jgi:hypothetical protein